MAGGKARNTSGGRKGMLLVVSGPSGVGKGTVINRVLERHPEARLSVSCTTRAPRPGEVEGRDYQFVSVAEFERRRDAGEFLEWAVVHQDLYYGTPRRAVEEAIDRGEDIIFEIDYQGARALRTQMPQRAVLVFMAPPSWQALVERLRNRQTESPEAFRKRLATARREIEHMSMFQYVIVNDRIETAAAELEAILVAEHHRLVRVDYEALQARLLAEAEQDEAGGDRYANT